MAIGPRVRERRIALGLSQEQLARRADISLNAMGKLETGRITDPHYSTLSGIAHALGTTVAELVGEEESVLAGPKADATRQVAGTSVPRLPRVSLAALSPEELEIRLFGAPVKGGEVLAPVLAVEEAHRLVRDVRTERDALEDWVEAYAAAPAENRIRVGTDKTRAEVWLARARLYYLVLLDYWSKLADPRGVPFKGLQRIVSETAEAQGLMQDIKRHQDELRRLAKGESA
jgi:transcriptional regulator with XRE-family HTH domain